MLQLLGWEFTLRQAIPGAVGLSDPAFCGEDGHGGTQHREKQLVYGDGLLLLGVDTESRPGGLGAGSGPCCSSLGSRG